MLRGSITRRLLTVFVFLLVAGLPLAPYMQRAAADSPQEGDDNNELGIKFSDKAYLRGRHYYKMRAFPFDNVPTDWRVKALDHIRTRVPLRKNGDGRLSPLEGEMLRPIGPAPIANGQTFGQRQNVTGRVTTLAVDPQNPATVYLGGAQGGVWRTTNGGQTWQPMTDNAPTQAIGAIAIDPTNRNVIYAGTGEGNLSGDSFAGIGLLKSTDGGQSWTLLATDTFRGLAFSNLVIDPRNTNTLYASIASGVAGLRAVGDPRQGRRGIYKSTDGGVSWTLVLNQGAPPLGNSGTDIEIDLNNPSTLYATILTQGVFKTTDGGQNWTKLTGGLPQQNFDRPDIGISRSDSNTVYAAFGNSSTGDLLGIFKSTDGGNSWASSANPPRSGFGNICQCFYDNIIVVDPNDANTVYYGGVGYYKSVDGGNSWRDLSRGTPGMHADFHAMAFGNSSNLLYVGNDGGIWTSPDGGNVWNNINNNLNITQFTNVAVHPTDPRVSIGGTQDNGTNLFTGTDTWQHVLDGDGGIAQIDQSDGNIVYAQIQSVSIRGPFRSESGGRFGTFTRATNGINQSDPVQFYAPFILDPNNQSTLYFGTFRLYRSTDRGNLWMPISDRLTLGTTGVISTIAVAPGQPRNIYTGSNNGGVFASTDGGTTFRNVTDNLPTRAISDIAVDPTNPLTVYVTLSGFLSGHVFRSTTGGGGWVDITNNLPDVPANAIVLNSKDPNQIFVGNDMGLFQSDNGGASWMLVPGMPFVAVFDISINENLGFLRLATHGRGIYELRLVPAVDRTPPTVTVMAPNGGESLTANAPFTITWTTTDNRSVVRHNIDLSTDGGATFPTPIASGLAGTAQSFIWNVPATMTSQARVRVTAVDDSNNEGSDASNGNFAIVAPSAFMIVAAPAMQTVTAGGSTTFNVNIMGLAGFSQAVNLTAAVVPADSNITASFSQVSVLPGNSSTLTISAGAAATAGTFNINITGVSGAITRTASVMVTVVVPDFALAFNPAQLTVSRGDKGTITANVNRTGGFAGNVTVAAPDTKAIKVKLTPTMVSTTGATASFTFKVKKGARAGTQQLLFTATDSSGRARTATLTLVIQ